MLVVGFMSSPGRLMGLEVYFDIWISRKSHAWLGRIIYIVTQNIFVINGRFPARSWSAHGPGPFLVGVGCWCWITVISVVSVSTVECRCESWWWSINQSMVFETRRVCMRVYCSWCDVMWCEVFPARILSAYCLPSPPSPPWWNHSEILNEWPTSLGFGSI